MITPGKPFTSNYRYTVFVDRETERCLIFKKIKNWAFSNLILMKIKNDDRHKKITIFLKILWIL
jgi:hypothetical protein